MKKNQIALLCLTAVIMLAVWYIKSPLSNVSGNDDTIAVGGSTSRLDALKTMRETLREERSIQVVALDKIIASEESSIAEKNTAINQKQLISDMTEKEVLMELSIINLGYIDAFVHQTEMGVEVLVISDALSDSEVIEIMNLTYNSFTTDTVIVTYKSATDFS